MHDQLPYSDRQSVLSLQEEPFSLQYVVVISAYATRGHCSATCDVIGDLAVNQLTSKPYSEHSKDFPVSKGPLVSLDMST